MPNIQVFLEQDAPNGKTLSLGIDDDGNLYVNGERVVTEQKITLKWWVDVAVIFGALGAFSQGFVSVYLMFK